MNRSTLKVYREEAKDRLTNHWDLDCLTNEQLEQLYLAQNTDEMFHASQSSADCSLTSPLRRWRAWRT